MTDSERFDLILEEIRGVKGDVQGMKSEMQGMKGDIQSLRGEMQGMKSEMQGVKSDIQSLQEKVTGIEVHLENVTDRNIQLIAEGHLDLNRKLDEAVKVGQQKEMWGIRLNILEEEVRKIKEQLPLVTA